MNRRSLIQGILAAGIAPAFVRGGMGILMPVKKIWSTPPSGLLCLFIASTIEEAELQRDWMLQDLIEAKARRPGLPLVIRPFEVFQDPEGPGFIARQRLTFSS